VIGYGKLEDCNLVLIMDFIHKLGLLDIVGNVKEINGLRKRLKSPKENWRVIINNGKN
jgi:hypothetical protein